MERYNVTVRSVSADRFFIQVSDNSQKIALKLDTLTPHKELTEAIPEADIMILRSNGVGVSKTSSVSILHKLRTRDRIAVDGKERLYISIGDELILNSGAVSASSDKSASGKHGMSIKASVNVSVVSPTLIGDLDTAADMAALDELMLEDIDYTES